MKEMPTDDRRCSARARSAPTAARFIPAYLFEVKKPAELKYPWDYYKQIATIPPEDAANPLAKSDCPLLKK